MNIDTTYLLPLARIGVKTDLLRAITEGSARRGIGFRDLKVSLISLSELQARGAKLGIPPRDVARAVNTILKTLPVIPFYWADIVEVAHELRKVLVDYIDCVIVATAAALREDLVAEDRDIHSHREELERNYGIKILSYRDHRPKS